MRKSVIFFLMLLYVGSNLRFAFPLVEYCINQDYIAKVLCINKDKQELKCEGKCYLMSRISEEEKKDTDPKSNINVKIELHFLQFSDFVFTDFFKKNAPRPILYEENYFHLVHQNIFKPPKAC